MIAHHRDDHAGGTFLHSALIPGSDEELTTTLVRELHRSAHRLDEVLLVVSDRTRQLLTGPLRPLTDLLTWGDPAAYYQRLGSAYEDFRRHLAERAATGRRVHVIAEPDLTDHLDPGAAPVRADAYLAYEAVCNDTYAPYGCAVTCIWDSRHHPAGILDGARATHRYLLTPHGRQPSPHFRSADDYLLGRRPLPLPEVPQRVDHDLTLATAADLGSLRSALHGWASDLGLATDPAEDLVVAVVEVASNGLRHAGTAVRVRAWHRGSTLIVQCDDSAGLPVPATAGYHRPDPGSAAPGGRGLWLARQLADVVLIDATPAGTSVRLQFPHAVMHH
ncbi:putative anti-sigma regulatory factor [Actinoplanes sp. SE50]|uniref:sensor histidine kinase n=1 Tax=unclassified Actinoplanes TaxID=2626549 RepID=UPI00023EC85B|nr:MULTISPECIES: sensor histidine kinase [unclassified Actinoplanes]AEV87057.1 putative anti-sigma regulatory factor, serine/threonine protein kinase [Actinoplanes sp. SE50/110]ATO85455.1 putative anti-sigma regulatory factor [Actinoplanes sp. SE50]SLM02867.1 anti-sigma regulatory factor [Actinoplanes sp. SE50/110]